MGKDVVVSDPALLADYGQAVDIMWLVCTGALVFFMQAGFTMLETGSVRVKNTKGILLKNTLDNCITGAIWWMWGYAVAFGFPANPPSDYTVNPFIGHNNYFLIDTTQYAFWFYQMTFAATAATIVSGAIAERAKLIGYFVQVCGMASLIYPFIAHWAWGGGWLANFGHNGYIDFAGSGVVHMTGGVSGLVGAIIVGARVGRFDKGTPKEIPGYSTTLICLGAFLLWFGWYGFNPGSSLALIDGKSEWAGRAAVNTTIAGAAGGLVCMLIQFVLDREWNLIITINGLLAGLVAITAPCAHVRGHFAIAIGAIAACVYKGASFLSVKLKIDDPVDAAPIHFACGFWGVISVGLFADQTFVEEILGRPTDSYGLFLGGGWNQLLVQFVAAVSIFGWSGVISAAVFGGLRLAGLLRVSKEEEVGSEGKHGKDSWARVQIMDSGRLDEYQFRLG